MPFFKQPTFLVKNCMVKLLNFLRVCVWRGGERRGKEKLFVAQHFLRRQLFTSGDANLTFRRERLCWLSLFLLPKFIDLKDAKNLII
jgi:hypothetical protein